MTGGAQRTSPGPPMGRNGRCSRPSLLLLHAQRRSVRCARNWHTSWRTSSTSPGKQKLLLAPSLLWEGANLTMPLSKNDGGRILGGSSGFGLATAHEEVSAH